MDTSSDTALQHDLAQHLPPRTRRVLHAAVDRAYADAGQRWSPDAGCNAMWFGFTTFTFVAHRIREAADADPTLGVTVLGGASGAFRLKAGPYLIAPYGCGFSRPEDPRTHFPNNDKGAGLLADINLDQLEIFPQFETAPTALVLAHYGNYERGLEALYLKEPRGATQGRIDRWGYIEPIYEAGSGDARVVPTVGPSGGPPAGPRPAVLPGPATVVRPTVLPFKKKPAQDTGAEGA